LHFQELLSVIECIVFPLPADRHGEAIVDVKVSWRWWFVLVAGLAVLNNHQGVGDPGQKFTGRFAGLHCQIGKALHYHFSSVCVANWR
jgi:hypothetical protein